MNESTPADFSPITSFVRDLALHAGRHAAAAAAQGENRDVEHKGRVDLVTRVDHEVQRRLIDAITERFPDEPIVAEEGESAARPGDDHGAVWFLDPIDGTTNFVYGHPMYCVSIARVDASGQGCGVVYAPALDELFVAESGAGSWSERPAAGAPPVRLRASDARRLDDALLATGFPYHRGATAQLNLSIVGHALTRCRGIRRGGSAALDLCYVGAGRLDGFWEMALQPWDVAAGSLVAREAGAKVTDFLGRERVVFGRRVCAAAPLLHADLLALVQWVHANPAVAAFGPVAHEAYPLEGPLPAELTGEAPNAQTEPPRSGPRVEEDERGRL